MHACIRLGPQRRASSGGWPYRPHSEPVCIINLLILSDISDDFFASQNYFAEIEQAAFAPGHMVHLLFSSYNAPKLMGSCLPPRSRE